MTSVALEVGNVVHDVLEAFLRRLKKSDSNIDKNRFFQFARQKANDYFSRKTFIEIYYGQKDYIDKELLFKKIDSCLNNFINSPIYSWIFMKAITNRKNWMIEPEGYGETRLNGVKAYCKMDFLFPVDDYIYILDWKTGKKSEFKHTNQLIGYAAAASNNFKIPWNIILPKIIYLYPEFDEFEIDLREDDFENLFQKVVSQTEEMYSYCSDVEKNIPVPIDKFQKTPSKQICNYCNFQELCFPAIKGQNRNEEF
jgi:CRISPR/Cas system-associated exonuclease Cas4 (RecB family)